ncbi:NAD+ synthase [Peptostreptococcaceae bacterium oral taxon 113 str. W5053]|nr:NAD+ synthase [Peptostreptococcaceae bacterium oral taxon 113 str. W5053]
MNYQKLEEEIIHWLQDKVADAHGKGVVFGLSGGVDSAVTAYLSKKAFGDNALALVIPIESDPKDEEDAQKIIQDIHLNYARIDLTESYYAFLKATGESIHVKASSNVKARLRMIILYYYAQKSGYLVVGSSNRSEFNTGYFTKYGDSASDLLPLANIYKTEIWELAKHLGVVADVISKKPTAGLEKGQTDEGDFGFTYQELDAYLKGGEVSFSTREKIERLYRNSAHKRMFPPIFDTEFLR